MTCKNRMKGVLLFLFLIWGVVEQVYAQQTLQITARFRPEGWK